MRRACRMRAHRAGGGWRSRPITRAPSPLAIRATAPPTPPPTPRMATVSPCCSWPYSTAPSQATTKVTPMDAACSKDRLRGLRTSAFAGRRSASAWLPSRVNPTSPPVPQTSAPSHSTGPSATMPAKSRPGVRGRTVPSMAPATFLTSDGLTEAAVTCTKAEPGPATGIGTSTASSTSGGPNCSKRTASMASSSHAAPLAGVGLVRTENRRGFVRFCSRAVQPQSTGKGGG